MNLMPNTKPVCSSAAQAAMVEQKAAEVGLCGVNQTVSITEDFDGKTIDHLKTLPASVKFITEDGHGVQDNATMARAFAICTQRDITVMSHAEDMEISPWDYRLAEDIETGSRAAAAGGYTFVNLMPNTKPVCSSAAQAFMVEQKAAEVGLCDVNQTVSITENFDGVSIDHLKTLPAGVKFITEDGHGVQDNATMAKAFAICTQKDITVMSHAEDMEISPWDYRLAEDIETVRNCWLSEYYQTKLHMCHVSTRGALDAIQMAKLRGAPVTCEVTPHHLWFTNDTCDYRVNPPIRTADDVQALVDGIRTGIVDAIATDHAPHSEEDKLKGMAGMVGSETAFGVCYTKLCKQEGLPLEVLVHLMSTRPAEILGLAKGQLEPGYDADMVLVDLDTPYTVDKDRLHSKSHNTPFDGAELYGKVCATIKGGKLTYQAED